MKSVPQTNPTLLSLAVIVLCGVMLNSTGMAAPLNEPETESEPSTELKIASGGLTLLYFPVKAAYAALGGIVGGIAYVFGAGNEEAAEAVWTPTIKGTYQITPKHLTGEKPVEFFGRAENNMENPD